ncbi:hypothetical protein SGCOL_006990 [Colletotrichum sp. CLE4]
MSVKSAAATDSLHVSGLTRPLLEAELVISHNIYNGLPYIEDQLDIVNDQPTILRGALLLINQYDMGKTLRAHLAHRHHALDPGMIRVENKIQGTPYTLTRPMAIESVNISEMHPSCLKATESGLVAFEFAEGQMTLDASEASSQFFRKWFEFLHWNDATNLITLDCGLFELCAEPTTEIELRYGSTDATITVPISACIREGGTNIPTGWKAAGDLAGAQDSTPPPGQHWNESTKPDGTKTHKVHVDGLSSAANPQLVVQALVRQHILRPTVDAIKS